MKNKLKILILVFFMFPIFFLLFSCNNSLEEKINFCVSEYRENYFFAKTETFTVSFTDGKREKDYVYNGEKTDLVDYGIIMVKSDQVNGQVLNFELKVNDKTFVGEMERNPFDKSFVFDIETKVSSLDNLELYLVDFDEKINLVCLSKEWKINCGQALTKFVNENKNQLEKYVTNESFQGEIYIKLVADKNDDNNIYFYVLAVCKDGQVFGSLIDVKTGNVVQK